MIGSWRWNAAFGGLGFLLTLMFSLGNNPLMTSLIRSVYAFAAFALIAFAVRFVLGWLQMPASPAESDLSLDNTRGTVLDLVTPGEEEALNEMLKENWSDGGTGQDKSGFQPLQPKRLVSLDNPNPEDVVQAIRHLTDK